jgi:SAM-dependent methyltransferase
MSLLKRIARNRIEIERSYSNIKERSLFSAASRCAFLATDSLIKKYIKGKVLDIGCGTQPYRELILSLGASYEGFDVEQRWEHLDYEGDIHKLPRELEGRIYDCAISLFVWEHLHDPTLAARNVRGLLREDGLFILSAPHLSRIHEIPHDYFRFTEYGLHSVLTKAGFEPLEIVHCGGILSFVGHQLSTILVCLCWGIPVIQQLAFTLNRFLLVYPLVWLDKWIDQKGLVPLVYVCAARASRDQSTGGRHA